MSLTDGTQLGVYEITGKIGAGGMGEVYRATDTKLGRDVAIKTLPAALASDKDRLARFEREAKLLAALNHPHIASVYSLDEHEGTLYLAMELVEGETLEEKLKPGALPVEDALRLALQIAEALEAAHGKGVIHRDLKPANIMVTGDGVVKVLDFGLAKAFSNEPEEASAGQSPALSLAMTQQGIILGTAGYMSPEQASGQPTDQRADIWAFGVVLYEMLTGLPLFSGESVPHILADVLRKEPEWDRLPKNLHPRLKLMLERCLTKKPRKRYHSVADVRIDLEDVLNDPLGLHVDTMAATTGSAASGGFSPAVTAGLIVMAAVISSVAVWQLQTEPEREVIRFSIDLAGQLEAFQPVAVSPDGRRIVYRANDQLYSHRLDQLQATTIPGTEGGSDPFFTPDGQSVVYAAQNQLKVVGFGGDAPRVIADLDISALGGAWSADSRIVFGQAGPYPLLSVSAIGGVPELFGELGEYRDFDYPDVLPDSEWVLFTGNYVEGDWSGSDIVAQNSVTGERKVVLEGGHFARFISTGHLLFVRDSTLYAVAFDPERVATTGAIVPVVQGVATDETSGHAKYAVSANGTLIYMPGRAMNNSGAWTIVARDMGGAFSSLTPEPRSYQRPRVSPDGSRIAVEVYDANGGNQIWIMTLATGRAVQLTFDGSQNKTAVWTADSRDVLFVSNREGNAIYRQSADGAGQATRVLEGTDQLLPTDVLDGNVLVFQDEGVDGSLDILTFDLDDDGPVVPYLATPEDERLARISRDGNWMAYTSGIAAESRVFIRPYPDSSGGQRVVPESGGVAPIWSSSGNEIFFLTVGDRLGQVASVTVERTPTSVVPGVPIELFDFLNSGFQTLEWPSTPVFDLIPGDSADGDRVVAAYLTGLLTPDGAVAERPRLNVVLNWVAELERQVPVE